MRFRVSPSPLLGGLSLSLSTSLSLELDTHAGYHLIWVLGR